LRINHCESTLASVAVSDKAQPSPAAAAATLHVALGCGLEYVRFDLRNLLPPSPLLIVSVLELANPTAARLRSIGVPTCGFVSLAGNHRGFSNKLSGAARNRIRTRCSYCSAHQTHAEVDDAGHGG